MSNTIVYSSFEGGEVSPQSYGRSDMDIHKKSAKNLENIDILESGAVTRRFGFQYHTSLAGNTASHYFCKDNKNYLLVIDDTNVYILDKKGEVAKFSSIWFTSELNDLSIVDYAGDVFIASEYNAVQKISNTTGRWIQSECIFKNIPMGSFGAYNHPRTVAFAEGRMILAGCKRSPNRIFFSKTADIYDFSTGTGLADEGIDVRLLVHSGEEICALHSGSDLIIRTTSGEWILKSRPIMSSTLHFERYTSVGMQREKKKTLAEINDKVILYGKDGLLYMLEYDGINTRHKALNLTGFGQHLTQDIVDIAFCSFKNKLYCIRENGNIAVLHFRQDLTVLGWSQYTTQGDFKAVHTMAGSVYVTVWRNGAYYMETISDDNEYIDGYSKTYFWIKKQNVWKVNANYNNKKIICIADDVFTTDIVAKDNYITLPNKVNVLVVGYAYYHTIEPLALDCFFSGKKTRLRHIVVRLENTRALEIYVNGIKNTIGFRQYTDNGISDTEKPFSGDKKISVLGWRNINMESAWKIRSATPRSMTVLAVKMDVSIS